MKRPGNHRPQADPRAGGKPGFMLRLFIAGMSSRSVAAIQTIRKLCEQHLAGNYSLEIVDLYRNPEQAKGNQIVAVPTLVKESPQPVRRIIGSMSDEARVMMGLNVTKK